MHDMEYSRSPGAATNMTAYVESFDLFSASANNNNNSDHEFNKSAFTNYSIIMEDNSVDTICATTNNTSLCDKKGLGISLSTPILMFTFGLLGNVIALAVLYSVRNEMKRTIFFTFLCGLALTDLIGQLLTAPIAIVMYANDLKWVGGESLCKYHGFVMVFFGIITPLFVCCMSLERVLALRFPYVHERMLSKRRALFAVGGCWLCVTIFCCMPFIGFGSYEHQFPGSWCFLNFHRESVSDEAYAYTFAILNVIMIGLIIVSNFIVIYTLIKMKKNRKLHNSPSIERRNKPRSKRKVEEETQMVWFLCAITIVFTTCWLPLNIHILINQVTGRIDYAADLIGCRLASINQILDPWLYILLRRRVIIKALVFVRQAIFKDYKARNRNKFITNYNSATCNMNGTVIDKNVHELKQYKVENHEVACTPEVQQRLNNNQENDSSLSSVESDGEGEKVTLKLDADIKSAATDNNTCTFQRTISENAGDRPRQYCDESRKTSLP